MLSINAPNLTAQAANNVFISDTATGNVKLVNRMTVRAGRVVYDPTGLGAPEWQRAPKQYFTTPKLGSDPPASVDSEPRRGTP